MLIPLGQVVFDQLMVNALIDGFVTPTSTTRYTCTTFGAAELCVSLYGFVDTSAQAPFQYGDRCASYELEREDECS
jgi:hypothetical protein